MGSSLLDSMNVAVSDLNDRLSAIVDKYVKVEVTSSRSQMPWWTKACDRAYKLKLDAFESRSLDSAGYRAAVKRCWRVNRRAFKRWQATLRVRNYS